MFWTGCRIGELLALTLQDIDFKSNQINIRKTYYRINRKDVITTPKTEQSIRKIDIPAFLAEEIKSYTDKFYKLPENERLFPIVAEAIQHKLKKHCVKAGVKRIRLHSLRHSHTAYLIYQGVQPLIIKERLGHRDIKITLNTYGHLYPSQQKAVAEQQVQTSKNQLEKAKVEAGGKECNITPTEFRLLRYMIENKGQLLTYSVLLERLWDNEGQFVDKHALAVNVNRLRRKIEDGEHKYISNIYGMGYQWLDG